MVNQHGQSLPTGLTVGGLPGEDQGEVEEESHLLDQQQDGLQDGAAVGHEGGQDYQLDSQQKVELTNFIMGEIINCTYFHLYYF